MREIDCSICYRLTAPVGGPLSRPGDRRQIDYRIRADDASTGESIEKAIVASGIAEIQIVEGKDALFEIIEVRALGTNPPPSVLWG